MGEVKTETELDYNEQIYHALLASCEKAFRNGVNSAEIYEILMKLKDKTDQTSSTWITLWKNLFNLVQTLRKIFWIVFFVSISTIGTYWILWSALDVSPWPLSALHESRCLLPSHPLIMELTRPIANCSICREHQSNGTPVIEFNSKPSSEAFEGVAYSSKPIIIRGGATAAGMSTTFNFHSLKSLFESEPGGIESVVDECQFLPFRSSFKNLNEVFATISSDAQDFATPWYIGWSNCHPGVVAKLRKLFPRPDFLPNGSESSVIDWIFIGSPGYGAAMHLDYVRRPSWQAQLSGKKKWTLKPPPECELHCSVDVTFSINAGDMLFLDTNVWYHETYIEGTKLSISIGSEYD